MITFEKIINPGHVPIHRTDRQIFCKIKIENGELTISGVVGPARNGDAAGSCGQIQDELLRKDLTINRGWTEFMVGELYVVWNNWHLNHMRAGCEHQRALGWKSYDEHPLEPCPVCGYKFGTAWLKEELPPHVVAFLESLPESEREPAWV